MGKKHRKAETQSCPKSSASRETSFEPNILRDTKSNVEQVRREKALTACSRDIDTYSVVWL